MQIILKRLQNNLTFYTGNKYNCLARAKWYIRGCKLTTAEIKLDQYFKETYNISLKRVCLSLINKCTVQTDFDESLIIIWQDKELDLIASFITNGNRQVPGSDILRRAFY